MNRIIARYAAWLVDHRRLALPALLAIGGVMAFGASRVVMDYNTADLFASGDPSLATLDELKKQFGRDDVRLAIVFRADDVTLPAPMATIKKVANELKRSKSIRRVLGITEATDLAPTPEGDIGTDPVFFPLPKTPEESAKRKARALKSPLFGQRFLSKDATVGALICELDIETEAIAPLQVAVGEIRAITDRFSSESLRIDLAGIPFLRADSVGLFDSEQKRLTGLSSLVVVVFLLFMFRSVVGMLVPLIAVGSAAVLTLGFMGWVGIKGDMINIALPTLVLVIGVADAVHMLARFNEEWTPDRKRREAIVRASGFIGAACVLTSLTTCIGFGTLRTARMIILQRFGALAALGVVFAYISVVTWVPVALAFVRREHPPEGRVPDTERGGPIGWFLDTCDRLSRNHPWPFIVGAFALMGVGAWSFTLVRMDGRLTAIHPPDHPTLQVHHIFEEKLAGVLPTEILIRGEENVILEPDTLRRMQTVQRWLEEQPEIRTSTSPADIVSELHYAFADMRTIPDSRQAVAQLLLLAEGDTGLRDLTDSKYRVGRISATGLDVGAENHVAFITKVERAVDDAFEGHPAKVDVTGTSVVAYRALSNLLEDLMRSVTWAFGLIMLVMFPVIRSLRLALLSIVPNVFPVLVGGAFMALLDIPLEPATSIIFAIAIGIAVDDTIHFLVRYKEEVGAGADEREAIRTTIRTSGRAMLYTTLILTLGFLTVATTEFPPLQHFGLLGSLIILAALLGDLLVLPAFMAVLARWKRQGRIDAAPVERPPAGSATERLSAAETP